jgi:hypothetical protein
MELVLVETQTVIVEAVGSQRHAARRTKTLPMTLCCDLQAHAQTRVTCTSIGASSLWLMVNLGDTKLRTGG